MLSIKIEIRDASFSNFNNDAFIQDLNEFMNDHIKGFWIYNISETEESKYYSPRPYEKIL